jgi:hypothetical protein
MRIHPVNFLIALLISALLTFGLVSLDANLLKGATGIGSFIFSALTLALALGVTFENARAAVNLKVLSLLFFVLGLGVHLLFAFLWSSLVGYVICSGIAYLVHLLLAQSLYGARQ